MSITLLGEFIRKRRIEFRMSQAELAQKVGVAQTTISGWETGDRKRIAKTKAISLAEGLQCDKDEILKFLPRKSSSV